MNAIKENFIGTSSATVNATIYHTSDGMRFRNFKKAFRHEMFLRIFTLFPESAFGHSKRYGGKGYYFTRHDYIKCGIYRIVLKDSIEMEVMNHFFRGLVDALPEIGENDYPYEFDIDIYYENYPGILIPRAQWRLYSEDNYR